MEEQKKTTNVIDLPMTPSQDPDEETIDLLELAFHLLAHWKAIVCTGVCVMILVGLYTFFLVTPMYEATSTIYVLSRRDTAINMSDLQLGSALTGDYAKVFQMWEVHEQVISNLELPYSYEYMSEHLNVVNDSGTRMLDITFTAPSPSEAADVANEYAKVASAYIASTMATDQPSIMSVALAPVNPSSPHLLRNLAVGLLAGVVACCAVFVVQALLDDKFKTADDISKYTGLITLTVIPVDEAMSRDSKKKASAKAARRDA